MVSRWLGPATTAFFGRTFELDCDMRQGCLELQSGFTFHSFSKEVAWIPCRAQVQPTQSVCLSNLHSYTQSGRKGRSCLHIAPPAHQSPAPTFNRLKREQVASHSWRLHSCALALEFVCQGAISSHFSAENFATWTWHATPLRKRKWLCTCGSTSTA